MAHKHVCVIGGGIIGSTIACELSKHNLKVSVVDCGKSNPPATPSSFGWINAHSPQQAHHFGLRLRSMDLWKSLSDEFPDLPVFWKSALDWDFDPDELQSLNQSYNNLGYTTEIVDRKQIQKRFTLETDIEFAILSNNDAVAIPEQIAGFFSALAQSHGAIWINDKRVDEIVTKNNRVTSILIDGTKLDCDCIVVAAGCGSPILLEQLGIDLPITNKPGLLVRTTAQPTLFEGLVSSPSLHFWQLPNGQIIAGENQAGDILSGNLEEIEAHTQKRLAEFLPNAIDLKIASRSIAVRPQPIDGMPALGICDKFENLHVAVLHSGITLAPIIADLVSSEIIKETVIEDLKPYRIERFQEIGEAMAS
ncbi:MAG: FAD-binding oxidoreductase [Pseudomonadota bacterium]